MNRLNRLVLRITQAFALGASAGLQLWGQGSMAPVAARDLARGTVLSAVDVRAATPAQAERFAGWEVRRVLKAGEAVKEPAVVPPPAVMAGATVTVEAIVDGVRVTRTATAMGRAMPGERVTVRLDARRILMAVVTGPNTVRLEPRRALAAVVPGLDTTRLPAGAPR